MFICTSHAGRPQKRRSRRRQKQHENSLNASAQGVRLSEEAERSELHETGHDVVTLVEGNSLHDDLVAAARVRHRRHQAVFFTVAADVCAVGGEEGERCGNGGSGGCLEASLWRSGRSFAFVFRLNKLLHKAFLLRSFSVAV